ncbi:MAG: hypothetical protein ACI3YT_01990, partial [Prevotella sp.]
QPMVAVVVSVLTGLGIFKPAHALAVVLVFFGVRFVTKSKSRRDLEEEHFGESDILNTKTQRNEDFV